MYFFTEFDKLTSQGTSNDRYGPLNVNDTNKYEIGALFDLTANAKAIACQDALMLVQSYLDETGTEDASLVNIILKPTKGLKVDFRSVRYYVYRGIRKESLMNAAGDAMKGDAPSTNSEFLNEFWENITVLTNEGIITTPPSPVEVFGYDSTAISTPANQPANTLIEDIYNSLVSDTRAVVVKEGQWIGEFSSSVKIGFEVIIDSEHTIEDTNNPDYLRFDLGYFRKHRHIVDVTDVSPISGSLTTVQEDFKRKVRREEILAYIDPCAFYGMHFYKGVKERYDNTGTLDNRTRKKQDLREFILVKFSTNTDVYIDVRSEFGYSYNFYDNYFTSGATDAWEIITEAQTSFTSDGYYTHDWPIFIAGTWLSALGKLNTVGIKMKMGDENKNPIAFMHNAQLVGRFNKRHFVDWFLYPIDPSPAYADPFLLKFPNNMTDNGSTVLANSISTHLGLQYFRIENYAGAAPTKVLKHNLNIDTAFGDIRLPLKGSSNPGFNAYRSQKMQLVVGAEFNYAAYPEAYWDASSVLFFTEIEYANKRTVLNRPRKKIESNGPVDSTIFPKGVFFQKTLVIEDLGGGATQNLHVLDVSEHNKRKKGVTKIEDLFVLGMTQAEHASVLSATSSLSKRHPQFMMFEEQGANLTGVFSIPYKKYRVKVQGLDDTGARQEVLTSVYVYTFNDQVFGTNDFVTAADVPIEFPDPGTMKQWEFVGEYHYKNFDRVKCDDYGNNATGSTSGFECVVSPTESKYSGEFSDVFVTLNARVYFPADSDGVDDPANISTKLGQYPLVVMTHGNGQDYTKYEKFIKHLASNGFIAVSIDNRYSTVEHYEIFDLDLIGNPAHAKFSPHDKVFVKEADGIYAYEPGVQKIHSFDDDTDTYSDAGWTFGVDYDIYTTGGVDYIRILNYAKINLFHGMGGLGRAHSTLNHLEVLLDKFTIGGIAKFQSDVGLIGHSRGGEAIVTAQRLKPTYASLAGINIAALYSLAPTDQFEKETVPSTVPYFMMYGSKDGDLSGTRVSGSTTIIENLGGGVTKSHTYGFLKQISAPTPLITPAMLDDDIAYSSAFSLYDRANSDEKSMVFIHGASHNGFNLDHHDYTDKERRAIADSVTIPPTSQYMTSRDFLMKISLQETMLCAYGNAFFRQHLKAESFWSEITRGNLIPKSVRSRKAKMHFQHHTSSSSSVVNYNATPDDTNLAPDGLGIGLLRSEIGGIVLDQYSQHGTKAVILDISKLADNSYDAYNGAAIDASPYEELTFRISKKFGDYTNLNRMTVVLYNAGSEFELSLPQKVPSTYERYDDWYYQAYSQEVSKSAMITIKMPLADFAGLYSNNITRIELRFNTKKGTVELDDFAFSN